jgi:ABC-type glycerol-3-phosphate transport system substrate-binding protein
MLGNPVAPLVKTLAATGIVFDGATLNGSVDARGSERAVFFDYGTTTELGMSVPAEPASVDGTGVQAVSATIDDLLPLTKYFFRTRAEGLLGAASAAPLSFTTANRAPTGNDDSFTVLPGSVVALDVLHNDDDPDADPLSLTSVTAPAAGAKVKKTGNTVNVLQVPKETDQRLALYQQQLGAKAADVDVYIVDVVWPGLISQHLADLKSIVPAAQLKEYFPSMVENNTVNGKLVAMPWFTDAGLMYYRTDLLKKYGFKSAPKTWTELALMAKKIQDGEQTAQRCAGQGRQRERTF